MKNKEILGHNLKTFFERTEIHAACTYEHSENEKDYPFEVWEVSVEDHSKMCDMPEDEFEKLAGEDAWWRSASGSNIGYPTNIIEINGHKVKAWRGHSVRLKHHNLLEYFEVAIGASLPRNVCALAVDLARYNDMTMAELFQKMQE